MEDITPLVDFDEALRHLNAQDATPDVRLVVESKLQEATAIIVDYLGAQADASWEIATVPGPVHTAILLQLAHLHAYRGDDLTERDDHDDHLAPGVRRVLRRLRDPVVA
jgi:hypothetical protein